MGHTATIHCTYILRPIILQLNAVQLALVKKACNKRLNLREGPGHLQVIVLVPCCIYNTGHSGLHHMIHLHVLLFYVCLFLFYLS